MASINRLEPAAELRRSKAMLRSVLQGQSYEVVAREAGVTRTVVERRVKSLALKLSHHGSVPGLSAPAATSVLRLRAQRDAILAALDSFEPALVSEPQPARVLSDAEIVQAAQRIKLRSARPWHDQALFYLLFATGARPLEIARLEVRDYLEADGRVRVDSVWRAEIAANGRTRPLYFTSTRLNETMGHYLEERLRLGLGIGAEGSFRGLDPRSRLFLSSTGQGFQVIGQQAGGRPRHLCRPILETYRKLFRHAGLSDLTPLAVRMTLVSRVYARGGDEEQVAELLGIGERSAVRERFPRPRPPMAELLREVV